MTNPDSPFEKGLKMMGAQQQLATRSLVNLIEMISTSSHRYAQETTDFTRDALSLMQEASRTRDPAELRELQSQWAKTCVKYSQNQTRATMTFVEQCGLQALNTAATTAKPPQSDDTPEPPKE
ncbi:phasin [Asticcacaulis sp. YBE204]|uniref:phasin n=1 Tax=Asticcacaulis sp. YBE204 TaxID=1282363 RepID=UPI0003C3BF92|nr:phasin [Asticcacaulis sp. YBE204]ESQ81289.1 phasin [Asticcacaulis sp. YBE204]